MTSRPDDEDARSAEALRRALARSAAEIHPLGDGLTKIRARTAKARRQRWLVPVAAGAAAVVVAGGITWAASAIGPREDPFASAGPTTSGATATVPVYYLGAQPRESGDPLYKVFREYRRVPTDDASDRSERVRLALTEMFANAPLDDDYFGRWPEIAAILDASVDLDSAVVTVDLTGLEWSDVRLPDPDGRLVSEVGGALVQQLVYTATAAASKITTDDEFSATGGVQLLVDGAPVGSLLGVDTSRPVKRDPDNYQAIIWITDPEWGETAGNPITVRLVARLHEGGPASWELSQNGTLVATDQTPTGAGDRWDDYEFAIDDLAPGTYQLEVFDLGGLGDRDLAPYDTKTFTVK